LAEIKRRGKSSETRLAELFDPLNQIREKNNLDTLCFGFVFSSIIIVWRSILLDRFRPGSWFFWRDRACRSLSAFFARKRRQENVQITISEHFGRRIG